MARVIVEISMSLDGFVTGPDDRPDQGLGEGGDSLHDWAFDNPTDADRAVFKEYWDAVGAVISGATTFDNSFENWGGKPPGPAPWFVLMHENAERRAKGEPAFRFATDGLKDAVAQAKEAAEGKDVLVMGGASTCRQVLQAGLADELSLHVVPLLMGSGKRLFEDMQRIDLEPIRCVHTQGATHVSYRVKGAGR